MSHFYASIEGNRGMATRCGTKASGMIGHIRGWGVGIRVDCDVNDKGEDEIHVSLTGGSGGHKPNRSIGTFTANDL